MILTPKHGKFALEEWDLSGENADLPHEESVISPQVSTEPSENWGSFTNKKSGFTQLSWGYDRMTQTGDATNEKIGSTPEDQRPQLGTRWFGACRRWITTSWWLSPAPSRSLCLDGIGIDVYLKMASIRYTLKMAILNGIDYDSSADFEVFSDKRI